MIRAAQLPHFASKPFGAAGERTVEGRISVLGPNVTLHHDATANMDRNINSDSLGFTEKLDVALDRIGEKFYHRTRQIDFDTLAQVIAIIELVSRD